MEKAKREGEDEQRGRGRSFWLRRLRRIHERASFSKVSARTRMPLVDSRMGTGRINDRNRDRLPKESLPFVHCIFFPHRKTMEIRKKVPLFDYAENYRNFRCLSFCARAQYIHDIQVAFSLSVYTVHFTNMTIKNDFAEIFKNLARSENNFLDLIARISKFFAACSTCLSCLYQNNYVGNSSMMSNIAKNFSIVYCVCERPT